MAGEMLLTRTGAILVFVFGSLQMGYAGATSFPFLVTEGFTLSRGPGEQMSSVGRFAPLTCVSGGFGFGGTVIQVS